MNASSVASKSKAPEIKIFLALNHPRTELRTWALVAFKNIPHSIPDLLHIVHNRLVHVLYCCTIQYTVRLKYTSSCMVPYTTIDILSILNRIL